MGQQQNLPPAIGIDLGGTQLRVALFHGAHLAARTSLSVGSETTPDHIISQMYVHIQRLLIETQNSIEQIAGIGVSIAGPLDHRTGTILTSPNLPGWNNVPLRDIFEKHYHIPTFIENDANAAALGECMFGAGQGYKDVVYLTVSTGIGGGIIVNGKLVRGTGGAAGELGHMTIDRRGEQCNCGNTGCLESIASGSAIARRANYLITSGKTQQLGTSQYPFPMDARMVATAAHEGIQDAQTIVLDAAEALGIGLVNVIHIFNPEVIILGGGLIQMGPMFLEPALNVVQTRAMWASRGNVQIIPTALGDNAGLTGAAALVYHELETRKQQQTTRCLDTSIPSPL